MTRPKRSDRRRRRDETRAAVRAATIELIREVSFADVTVEELAAAAGLSRSAFYLYFRDKQDIVVDALEEIAAALKPAADRFCDGTGPPRQLVREAVEGIVGTYDANAEILGLAADLASHDDELRALYNGLLDRYIEATTYHLTVERESGRLRALDPAATAEVLVWSVERACYAGLAHGRRTTEQVAETLIAVWTAALYPDEPVTCR